MEQHPPNFPLIGPTEIHYSEQLINVFLFKKDTLLHWFGDYSVRNTDSIKVLIINAKYHSLPHL